MPQFDIKKHIKNDIVILAVYPKNLNYIFTINMLLKYDFKKIIIIYSAEDSYKIGKACLLENPKIQMVKVDNIGYDFKKYYIGLLTVKNEKYNRIWLINDSFIITKPNIFVGDMWRQILYNDLFGCYRSHEIKEHIQSYFMILSNKMVARFVSKLAPYKFTSINSVLDKKKINIGFRSKSNK